jgi:hypothetical protein
MRLVRVVECTAMADNDQNAGTTPEGGEAQITPEANTAPAAGTPAPVDEVTTLRSRNAGLDAKVSTLMQQIAAEKAAREAAEAKAQEYVSGRANEDEDTRALLQRLSAELESAKTVAKVADLRAKYPETYSVLGDAISGLTEEALAASEARFLGVPAESNTPPKPVGNNAARPLAPANKPIEEMTLAELKEHAKHAYAGVTWESITQDG